MTATAQAADAGRALWLVQRRRGIGGSDAAAILGVSPYQTAFDVWLEKTGSKRDQSPTKQMEWGHLLEDVLAERYMQRTGYRVWKPDQVMAHPDHPFLLGTPDRLVIGEQRGLEIKTCGSYLEHKWGAEGTDEIPREYIVQCLHYMAITGFDVWDVIVLIGGNDDRIYTVRRDKAFERILVERLTTWWEKYIVNGEQHPIDGGAGASAYLAERYPTDKAPRVGADETIQMIGNALAKVKEAIKSLEAEEADHVNRLKAFCGDASGIDAQNWRATWTGGRTTSVMNHELLAQDLMMRLTALGFGDEINDMLAKRRTEKVTPRAFRFTAGK